MTDLIIDRVVLEGYGGLHLAAERGRGDFYDRSAGDQPVWTVRLPAQVTEELGAHPNGSRQRYLDDPHLQGRDFIQLTGLGDDLDAVRAGLEQIATSITEFLDRLHVARLSVVGELGDAPKVALRARTAASEADG